MGHDNTNLNFLGTVFLWLFAHWTKNDIALYITMLAGISTLAVNIKKYFKDK